MYGTGEKKGESQKTKGRMTVFNTDYTLDIVMGAYTEKMLFNPYRNSMGVRILTPTS